MLAMRIQSRLTEWKGPGAALLVLILLLVPARTQAQSWTWTAETVDTSAKSTSLAVDGESNVHIAYVTDEAAVMYAFRPAGSSRWFKMRLDGAGSAGNTTPAKLALDAQGDPHVCYTPGTIRLASFNGGKWNIQQIAPRSGLIGYNCAVAIAPDGTPHVTWYHLENPNGSDYLHMKYAVLREGVWIVRTIDFSAQTGKWHSLAIDTQGNPHISYDAFVNGQLKYAYWNGKSWSVKVVDSRETGRRGPDAAYSVGMGSNLLLDREGKVYISYEDNNSLRYARQKDNSWLVETVDMITPSGSWVGYRSGQVLDRRGFPHIAYEDAGAVKHAYWDGKQWRVQVISPTGLDRSRFPDIAIDREDNLFISYRDALDDSLRVAVGRPTPASQTAQETR